MINKQHYLISLPTNDGIVVHCYMVTEARKYVSAMAEKLLDIAEQQNLHVMVPIVLSSDLNQSGIRLVEDKLLWYSPPEMKVAEKLEVVDYKFAVFMMSNEESRELMDLH